MGKGSLVPYKVEGQFVLTSIRFTNLGSLVLFLESNGLKIILLTYKIVFTLLTNNFHKYHKFLALGHGT